MEKKAAILKRHGRHGDESFGRRFYPSTSKVRCNISRKLIYQKKTQLTIFCCSVSLATVYLGFDRFTTEN
jgi:hypothetical protein